MVGVVEARRDGVQVAVAVHVAELHAVVRIVPGLRGPPERHFSSFLFVSIDLFHHRGYTGMFLVLVPAWFDDNTELEAEFEKSQQKMEKSPEIGLSIRHFHDFFRVSRVLMFQDTF